MPPLTVRISAFSDSPITKVHAPPETPRRLHKPTAGAAPVAPATAPETNDSPPITPETPNSDDAFYFPRSELTRPPEVAKGVDLQDLAKLTGARAGNVAVELFIDEHGAVAHIDTEPGDIDPDFLERLKSALAALRFSSGEINGFPVRSRIKIEIGFVPVLGHDYRRN